MNELYGAAKKYVDEWGFSVIPLESGTKRPLEGFSVMPYKSRMPDNGELYDWFADHSDRGIAVLCGGISAGLLVLDIDHVEHFASWEKAHPDLADTRKQKTRRGYHLLFHLRDRATTPSDTPFYFHGEPIGEVKWNGYIMAEPSTHPETGRKEHRWMNPEDPIVEIPAWETLGLQLEKPMSSPEMSHPIARGRGNGSYAQRSLESELASLATTARGNRNNQLNISAFSLGRLVGGGLLDRSGTEQALTTVALNIGLCQQETEATIRSGIEAGMREPRTLPSDLERPDPKRLGRRLDKDTSELITGTALPCLDADLRQRIAAALSEQGTTVAAKRTTAGGLMLDWMQENGRFIRSTTDARLCYFYAPERRLFNLETNLWRAWLYALTGANPAGTDFAYLAADCVTAGQFGQEREVVKVAAWDTHTETLRVSRFDGTVYVLDGKTIHEEDNGEHVLFDDLLWWTPYTPNLERDTGTALRWATQDVTCFGGKEEMHALGYRAWLLATFFTELCPTRPLLVLLGEKGSGKTMALRILLHLLFGPGAQVSGVPDKPDGFTAAASATHVLVLDNLDQFTPSLRDKLARLSTGAQDHYRRLWTSNEMGTVRYRSWLAFTARTPDTLKRDDLADRLLLLPTRFIPDDERQPERHFLELTTVARDEWWGDVLLALNRLVATIRREGLPNSSDLRMADWESLGRLVARNEGNEELWNEFIRNLKLQQTGFLLSDDLLVEGLDEWMKESRNHGRVVKSRELHAELTRVLFDDEYSPRDWPQSTSAFGKKLASIREGLRTLYKVEWGKERNYWVYQFWPLEG